MENSKNKKIARQIIMYWVGEAWRDLENYYYKKNMRSSDRKAVVRYIHRYGTIIGRILRVRYEPH